MRINRKVNQSKVDEFINKYKSRKITRITIAKKLNTNIHNVTTALINRGVEIWDDDELDKRRRKKSKRSSKYFNWDEYRDSITFPLW